jgi:hypothetical protein
MCNYINTDTLYKLADSGIAKQAQDFGALPLEIKESLARQMAENRQCVVDEAASEIVELLNAKDEFITANVMTVAELQKQIDAFNALSSLIKKSTDYGLNSQNFLPLASLIGLELPSGIDRKLTKVPEDWTAPVAQATQS